MITEPSEERVKILATLDFAARAIDHDAWIKAADRFLDDLSELERTRAALTLRALTQAQMSSNERGSL